MSEYKYTDQNGNLIATAIESYAECCPACSSIEVKCKGSFHKCLKCGERFDTAIWANAEKLNGAKDD